MRGTRSEKMKAGAREGLKKLKAGARKKMLTTDRLKITEGRGKATEKMKAGAWKGRGAERTEKNEGRGAERTEGPGRGKD